VPRHGPVPSGILPRRMTRRRQRTSGIQRRERASEAALGRRLDERSGGATLPDWRLLLIGGVIVVGLVILGLVFLLGGGESPFAGQQQPDNGGGHVAQGVDCREAPQSDPNCGTDPYSSVPAASGPHWGTPAGFDWGVYSTPQPEGALIHNLEHGGIVIWYDPEQLDAAGVDTLARYVEAQNATGISGRYKFILSPWGEAEPLPAPVVAAAWRYLLELETADTDAIAEFARSRYGRSPEPNGGPGPPV
jgi:hypothetical protein